MKGKIAQAVAHSSEDVQRLIENIWLKAHGNLREQNVVQVYELNIPLMRIWRVDCVERSGNGFHFDYMIVVYEDAAHTLQIAQRKGQNPL
jgi:hypothetical protein